MRTTLYYLMAIGLFLMPACKSLDKLVDQGRYDDAIVLATKKLAGKKNKKTDHIRALEEAFSKVNKFDLEHISNLRSRGANEDWESIYNYALQIKSRQARIEPFLPIISKDGYVGQFAMVDIYPIMNEASIKMSAFLYENGKKLLSQARTRKDKVLAQKAFYQFQKIERYFNSYNDVDQLMRESAIMGTFHLLVKMDESLIPYTFENRISPIHLKSKWTEYHIDHVDGITMDVVSNLALDYIDISPEREVINNFNEEKEIERWVDARDKNGKILKDSLGNVIQVKEINRIYASIAEVLRTKDAIISVRAETRDYLTGELIDNDLFTHEIHFESDGCTFRGDRRALSDGVRKRVDSNILPFPTDAEMISEGVVQLRDKFFYHLQHLNLSEHFEKELALHE